MPKTLPPPFRRDLVSAGGFGGLMLGVSRSYFAAPHRLPKTVVSEQRTTDRGEPRNPAAAMMLKIPAETLFCSKPTMEVFEQTR
jgi:hypothetical protein